MTCLSSFELVVTDRVITGGNAVAFVRLSVRLFPLYRLNRLTFGLVLLFFCVGHYHGSQGIETEGHRLGLGLESRRGWSALDPQSRAVFCIIS